MNEKEKDKPDKSCFDGDLKVYINRLFYKHTNPQGFYKLLAWKKSGNIYKQ